MTRWTRLNQRGMTLVELLAVMIILGILASIGVVTMTNVIQHQKDQAFVGNALALKEGASLYIQQALTSGETLPEKITYQDLNSALIIEPFKDPDTGNYLEPSEDSYIIISENYPIAVCLMGEERNLCTKDGVRGPLLFSELSAEMLSENE